MLFNVPTCIFPLTVKIFQGLKEILAAQLPAKQAALKDLKTKYGNVSLGEVTVDQVVYFFWIMLFS